MSSANNASHRAAAHLAMPSAAVGHSDLSSIQTAHDVARRRFANSQWHDFLCCHRDDAQEVIQIAKWTLIFGGTPLVTQLE